VETRPPVQTWKLLIWAIRCWSKGAHGRVGGGICKSVITNRRLSAKLPNPPAPLGSTSYDLDSKFSSLHRWSDFHLIHCHLSITPCFLSRDGDRREMKRDSMATSPVNHRLLAVAGNRRERCSSILARRLVIRGSNSALSRATCLYQYLDVQQPPASVDFYCWMPGCGC
jgi:hypothetical protein